MSADYEGGREAVGVVGVVVVRLTRREDVGLRVREARVRTTQPAISGSALGTSCCHIVLYP